MNIGLSYFTEYIMKIKEMLSSHLYEIETFVQIKKISYLFAYTYVLLLHN